MNRLKLLAAIAVLGLPLAACEETTPPPPVGSIVGTVSIEGTGIDGVSVNLSNGNSTTTAGGGSFRFDNVEGGAYTVTISGFPSDATFDATSAAATISSAGQSVTLNFTGAYIRTASVMGSVTVENMGLGGVTVALSGVSDATATTDDNGQYAFTGLRMGNYSVEISGFDSDEVGFSATAAAVTVGVGESKIISFDGTYLRTAGIMGRVSVEGEGLEGVTVSLSGGPDATDMTTMTDAAGQYSFAKLRAGDYAVGISGYNADDYEFEVTSQNVTVALGETANVPFEGVLLRTAGVSGRVSVEGIGLADVMVTLSMADAEDATAMTDAGGLYAFSGLAAGDYTVAIALSEEQMAAYVFESTSADVTLEDDMTSIVNFEAEHAATASVTVQLFVDEGANGRNDMMDEGEGAFPTEAMLAMVAELGLPLALPISLAGPGVHDMQSGTAMADGSVVFAGLKAGQYQVIVSDISAETLAALPPALGAVLRDYSYGGPATGYPVALTVGQEAMQYAPIDITHTTVSFGVTLKNGETRGAPLPGAMVTLYADAMGETKVADMMTDSMGMAAIRFARAGTTGNMVHAAIGAADDYTVGEGMQAVMWDPQKTYTVAANDNDIVNLNVDLTYGGATITTGYGGGDALAGWTVSVAHGDTMYADTLDAMGMAAFKMTVDSAGALPAMFAISVDTIQVDSLDGGEMFEGTAVDHVHTGLALAGTVDAGMIEVNYTTQTLVVGAHHERDQVMGYTGNVLDGDMRDTGVVSLSIRYIDDNGRSRSFTAKEWDPKNATTKDGVTTFTGLPADENIIVQASVAEDAGVMLLEPDELAAYTALEENGVMGGAFGDMGGFSHTVSLCPLQDENPQDHGECSSFSYVTTHSVSGLVWKNTVEKDGDGFVVDDKVADGIPGITTFVTGQAVSLAPIEGKNLAGEDQSYTSTKTDTRKDKTKGVNPTHMFAFNDIAAGAYKLTVPDGWRASVGGKGADVKITDELTPLADDLSLDVTPATATVYGRVTGSDGFPLDSMTVTANGVSGMTDAHGRYIIDGIGPGTAKNADSVTVKAGTDSLKIKFAMNSVTPVDLTPTAASKTASISGTVRASGTNAPVAGVEIISSRELTNVATGKKLLTGDDGSYTAVVVAADNAGGTVKLTPKKAGMTFVPASLDAPAHDGAEISGIDFTGFVNASISGRVVAPGGGPMSGIEVSATPTLGTAIVDTTGVTGSYAINAPFGSYTMSAVAADSAEATYVNFDYPITGQVVNVAPGQSVSFGDIKAKSPAASEVKANRQPLADDATTEDVDESKLGYTANVVVSYKLNAEDVPEGYDPPEYVIQHNAGTDPWTTIQGEVVNDEDNTAIPGMFTITSPTDTTFMVRILATASGTDLVDISVPSATYSVAAIDPSASGVMARRQAAADSDEADPAGNFIRTSWSAVTNANSRFRVVVEVTAAAAGGAKLWLVLAGNDDSTIRALTHDATANQSLGAAVSTSPTTGTEVAVTAAELGAAISIAVESVQGTASADNKWKRSAAVPLAAKPATSGS